MESETRQQQKWRRQSLSEEFVELGPIKFLEIMRIVKIVGDNNEPIDNIDDRSSRVGVDLDAERMSHFLFGYFADRAEWNEVLEILER